MVVNMRSLGGSGTRIETRLIGGWEVSGAYGWGRTDERNDRQRTCFAVCPIRTGLTPPSILSRGALVVAVGVVAGSRRELGSYPEKTGKSFPGEFLLYSFSRAVCR